MSKQSFCITQADIIELKSKINQHNKIEQMLKKFVYNQTLSHQKNMNHFCAILKSHLNLQNQSILREFQKFISNDYNIPIEVNLQAIKYDQILTLIDEWLGTVKQLSERQNSDKLYNIKFRNILFNRVFVQEKQNIQDYFETLSEKKMLKPFDLYQLLQSILSHYVLYEFSCDNESFFQKTNSFNNFIQVVQKFKHSQRRIIVDNKSKDFDYIKIYEFQALISYWEHINPELELRSERRFNKNQKQAQTEEHKVQKSSIQIQTQKLKEHLSLDEIINSTIRKLNQLTEIQNNPNHLNIIQNLCQSLRKEKISLLNYQNQRNFLQNQKYQSQARTQSLKKSNYLKKSPQKLGPSRIALDKQIKNFENQNSIQRNSYNYNIIDTTSPLNSQSTERRQLNVEKSPVRQKKIYSYVEDSQNDNVYFKKSENHNRSQRGYKQRQREQQYSQNRSFMVNNYQNKSILIKKTSPNQRDNKTFSNKKHYQDQSLQIQTKMEKTAEQNLLKRLLTLIFNNYCNNQSLDIQNMNKFFIDIGIIQKQQTGLMLNLIKNKLVEDVQNIQKNQFFQIMNKIMKQDKDLTIQVIQQFIDLYIVHHGKIYVDSKIKQKSRLPTKQRQKEDVYQRTQQRNFNNSYNYSPYKAQIPLLPLNRNKYKN